MAKTSPARVKPGSLYGNNASFGRIDGRSILDFQDVSVTRPHSFSNSQPKHCCPFRRRFPETDGQTNNNIGTNSGAGDFTEALPDQPETTLGENPQPSLPRREYPLET